MNTIDTIQTAVDQAQRGQRNFRSALTEGMKMVGEPVLVSEMFRKGASCHRIDFARLVTLAAEEA